MIRLLAWHTFKKNVHDLRLVVLLAIVFAALVGSGVMGARDLARQRERTAALESRSLAVSDLNAYVAVLRFNPLGFAHAELPGAPGYLVVSRELVDFPLDNAALREITSRPVALDWTFVVVNVLTLVCLLFTFDAISGEAERGTLRLLLATGASRRAYFTGTFLGSLLTVAPVIVVGCLSSVVPVLAEGVSLDVSHWLRLGMIVLSALALAAVFIALGLLASALSSRAEVSLLSALSMWAMLVLVVPMGAVLLAERYSSVPRTSVVEDNLRAARATFYKQSYPLSSTEIDRIGERTDLDEAQKRAKLASLQEEIDRQDTLALDNFLKRVTDIRRAYLAAQFDQAERAAAWARLSPASCYREIAAALSGNGIEGLKGDIRRASEFRAQFADYAGRMRASLQEQARRKELVISSGNSSLRRVVGVSFKGVEFDRRGYPTLEAAEPTLSASLSGCLPALAVLGLSWLVIGGWGLFWFLRSAIE